MPWAIRTKPRAGLRRLWATSRTTTSSRMKVASTEQKVGSKTQSTRLRTKRWARIRYASAVRPRSVFALALEGSAHPAAEEDAVGRAGVTVFLFFAAAGPLNCPD